MTGSRINWIDAELAKWGRYLKQCSIYRARQRRRAYLAAAALVFVAWLPACLLLVILLLPGALS